MHFYNQVIYQIYPKSFYDSNGDGIGDLRGIIEKIPYLTQLTIDMIWLNPFFVSPQHDNGYDIADYKAIDPRMGTMDDFEELVSRLKQHGIEIMLDMVFNHTSTEHKWFQRALSGDPYYQSFYYIRPPKEDGSLPNNWLSKFGGPAWEKFGESENYYLHLYDKSQADLNWHNRNVRCELYKIINFWMEKGVKGFRFDVINVIGKDLQLQDAPPNTEGKFMYTDKPIVHHYLKEMNRASFGMLPDAITVGEMSSTTIANSVDYTNPDHNELSMVFNFHHLKVDYKDGEKWTKTRFDFLKLKQVLDNWQRGMQEGGGWNALFWNNHDQPRALNRFGDPGQYRVRSAKMLATVIHLLRGTPFIYMGEEIGMTDPDYVTIDDYVDIEAINAYHMLVDKGYSKEDAFSIIQTKARDNSRTPMQWTDGSNGGFSTHTPWLRPTNCQTINVEKELKEGTIFAYYQKLIQLRKQNKVIALGSYESLLRDHPAVYGYIRSYKGKKLVVLANFFKQEAKVSLPDKLFQQPSAALISNCNRQTMEKQMTLEPYEATAFILETEEE
ncbi:MAG: alpha,alpha-phosphotrehalase [Sporolactobacillus sp.]